MQQSNSNWPLPGPAIYIQPPLTLFLNTTPPILQLSSPGVLAECTASKHSQPAPLDKEKKEKASKEEEKRGGCFLFRSSSETGQKFMCITINQNISSYNGQKVFIMARKCLQYSFRTSILLNAFNGRNLQCSSLLIILRFRIFWFLLYIFTLPTKKKGAFTFIYVFSTLADFFL